jgi:hypothetical protein
MLDLFTDYSRIGQCSANWILLVPQQPRIAQAWELVAEFGLLTPLKN